MNFTTRVVSNLTNPVAKGKQILCPPLHTLKLEQYKILDIST